MSPPHGVKLQLKHTHTHTHTHTHHVWAKQNLSEGPRKDHMGIYASDPKWGIFFMLQPFPNTY